MTGFFFFLPEVAFKLNSCKYDSNSLNSCIMSALSDIDVSHYLLLLVNYYLLAADSTIRSILTSLTARTHDLTDT